MKKPIKIALVSLAALVVLVAAAAGVVSRLVGSQAPPRRAAAAAAGDACRRPTASSNTASTCSRRAVAWTATAPTARATSSIDDKDSGFFVRAPNITAGGASPARSYTDTDWVRTLRHGVKPSGQPLLIMPSEDYARMTDADVAAIVAYVRSLPPANTGAAEIQRVSAADQGGVSVRRDQGRGGEDRSHGAAARRQCRDDCSRAGSTSRRAALAVTARTSPAARFRARRRRGRAAANLTSAPDSGMAHYTTAEQFKSMLRTGKRPDGSAVSTVMPFKSPGVHERRRDRRAVRVPEDRSSRGRSAGVSGIPF